MCHIFLITYKKFYAQNVFPLEDSSENVTSYGNHNLTYTVKYRRLQIYKTAAYIQMVWLI